MALTAGTRLGVYEVTTQIGEGGMGQVWRAHDTKLNRDVALKVLPDSFANDPDRLARFTREAQTLAALNHPNIAHIHGLEESDGVRALVMELVEGEDLSKPIARGAILIDEALPIAKQIADALEAAHEQGIIHRDLKPANIKVRDDGTVKVLDFGLSKALDPTGASSADVMNSPTLTARATQMGVILGTAAYMSPEQARGKPVDKRTDIWAFGCVLYEMLTATRAFVGDDVTDTVAAVLRAEPDWRAVPENVPTGVVNVLRRCLEKDRKARIPEIAAVRYLLEDALTAKPATASATAATPAITPRRPWMSIVATALVVGGLAAAAGWWLKRIPPVSPHVVTRFTYPLPEGQGFTRAGRHVLAISPDGTKFVYVANNQLYLRTMDQLDAEPIRGTKEDPMEPVFSPDGQWIAFFVPASSAGGGTGGWTLKKIAVTGGASVRLGQLPSAPYGAAWSNGMIVFGMNAKDAYGIQAVPEGGGTMRMLVAVDPKTERVAQPQLLDDGAHVLFVVMPMNGGEAEGQIVVQALNGGGRNVLVRGGTNPRVLPTGQLVYIHDGALLAVAFDAKQVAVSGGPVPLVDGVSETNNTWAGQFAISSDGTLAFVPGSTNRRTLVWVDRHGKEEAIPAPARAYQMPRLSPDGTKIAVDSDDEEHDIWVFDLARKTLTRLTFGPAVEARPVWTPDGKSVLFGRAAGASLYSGALDIFRQAADGTGTPEAVTQLTGGGLPWSVSPDGTLLYEKLPNPSDLRVLSLDRQRESRPLLADPKFDEWGAALSWDGRWLAYSSNESGRHEVYVRPFPNVDSGRWQISSGRGAWPRWARSGRELFFVKREPVASTTGNADFMAVPIQPGTTFTFATPQVLFTSGTYSNFFDVDLDAKRFLMTKSVGADTSARPSIVVVSHWFDEVRARVGR